MKPVADMTEAEREQLKAWARNWATLGPVLEELRIRDIEAADTERALLALDDAFDAAARLNPPRASSGLIEQQALFHRART